MKLCKLAETTTLTAATAAAASTSFELVLRFVTVAATKLQLSGKKTNMIPMVVFILFGISMNLVRAENQYRQPHQQRYQNNRQQQQRLQPNITEVDNSASFYEYVLLYL